jgi:2-polyprenyl-3-methyl-5-hydroxy-6-metoxy-1,4-benzoquinol methylase
MTSTIPAPAQADLEAFLGRFVGDMGAVAAGANIVLGDRLGLYAAVAAHQPATPADVAAATGTDERYVAEWLRGQAAGGYVQYDATAGTFALSPAQAACLADAGSPTYVAAAFQVAASLYRDLDRIEAAYRSGAGVGWHEHDQELFTGTERFFRPGYVANLVSAWIPALDGVEARLLSGASVADIGCGHGASTIIMAGAYPRSTFVGFDYHEGSIERARQAAKEAGVDDRVSFEVAGAADYPGTGYDLVAVFDALHDMGDPAGTARHVRDSLQPDGTWLIVEPNAGDTVSDNLNPVGRIFYSASSMICVPASRAQDGAACLGAQAGPAAIEAVVREGGFTRFRTATSTPFNLVFEARP